MNAHINTIKQKNRLFLDFRETRKIVVLWYQARIHIMNYHKELKMAGDTLFHADHRGMPAFEKNP